MRAPLLVAAIGLPAYLAFLVVTSPASFIAARASAASEGRARFTDTRGTFWDGSMRAHFDNADFDLIAWHFLPSKLAEGRIAFDVDLSARDIAGKARVARGWSDWEAQSGSVVLEARALPALVPMVAAWRPEGRVELSAQGVRWNDREMHGSVSGEWRDAAVALSDVKPLGTYRFSANGAGDTVSFTVSTLAGALRLAGKGEAKLPHGATFSGEARAEGASAPALEPLLNLMGPRRPDGARSIEVRIR